MSELKAEITKLLKPNNVVLIATVEEGGLTSFDVAVSLDSSDNPKEEHLTRIMAFAIEGVLVDFANKDTVSKWVSNGARVVTHAMDLAEAEKT